jgi:hypothetical protein
MADAVEALRLLHAFRRIEDAGVRQVIIRIVEAIARNAPKAEKPEIHRAAAKHARSLKNFRHDDDEFNLAREYPRSDDDDVARIFVLDLRRIFIPGIDVKERSVSLIKPNAREQSVKRLGADNERHTCLDLPDLRLW